MNTVYHDLFIEFPINNRGYFGNWPSLWTHVTLIHIHNVNIIWCFFQKICYFFWLTPFRKLLYIICISNHIYSFRKYAVFFRLTPFWKVLCVICCIFEICHFLIKVLYIYQNFVKVPNLGFQFTLCIYEIYIYFTS